MREEQIRGLILEEVIAKLLHTSGYQILTVDDDKEILSQDSAGLAIWGRGAKHQADTLGELRIPTPFSFPMRLFVEAKAYATTKVGLDIVRNALGVLNDVNERHVQDRRDGDRRILSNPRRYVYRYALFSTSGFTFDAQAYALAQQISLIDLSGPGFKKLTDLIFETSRKLAAAQPGAQGGSADDDAERLTMATIRDAFRASFKLAPSDGQSTVIEETAPATKPSPLTQAVATAAADIAAGLDEHLLLAFPDAPFVLVMQTENSDQLGEILDSSRPEQPVDLVFPADGLESGEWVMTAPDGTSLSRFGLPPLFDSWLMGSDRSDQAGAALQDGGSRSTITMYRPPESDSAPPTPVTFTYRPVSMEALPEGDEGWYSETDSPYRRARQVPRQSHPVPAPPDPSTWPDADTWFREQAPWPEAATWELMDRLRARFPDRAQVMRLAAGQDGRVSRADVYAVADYPADGLLTGFTLPTRNITRSLVDEGILDDAAPWPLVAWFPRAGRAACFLMPPSVRHAIITQASGGPGRSPQT